MRILLISTNYWPEPSGIAVYTTDLAEALLEKSNSVSVLTSLPHYPWWRIPSEYVGQGEGVHEINGVRVHRAKHLIPSQMNAVKRMRFEFSLWRNLNRVSKALESKDFEAVISCIPTVAAGLVGKRLARRFNSPFGLIVQDLSGAGAKQSGLKGGALFSAIATRLELSVIAAADQLVVVSPAMGEVIQREGYPANKITLIPNYSAKSITTLERDAARHVFGWSSDDFIVLHTGNMGAKQGLENVVEAARNLDFDPNIKIYLVGHGNREDQLKKLSADLLNSEVLPAVSDDEYSALLSAADLLLVNERPTQMEMSLPSKLTSYLYSNRPVLAAVPRDGATWKYLNGIAELVEAGNPEALAHKIIELKDNSSRRKELASVGSEFARNNLDPETGRKRYIEWVNQLISSK